MGGGPVTAAENDDLMDRPREVYGWELRRLFFMVQALRRALEGIPAWDAVDAVYFDDDFLVPDRTADGALDPEWMRAEIACAIYTLMALVARCKSPDDGEQDAR
jgi:hypothetical protein